MEKRKSQIITGIEDEKILEDLSRYEGKTNYMYLDTKGNVTIGIGRMIPHYSKVQNMPLRLYENGRSERYATSSEAADAYTRVKKRKYGDRYGANVYDPKIDKELMDVRLDDSEIYSMGHEDATRSSHELREKFAEFDQFPPSAQRALLDMQFNLGDTKFQEEYYDSRIKKMKSAWPKLFDAVKERDWLTAASQSHRKDIQEERNKFVYDLFKEASR